MDVMFLEDATADELAGIYTEVAEEIGMDNAYVLFKHFRGQQLSFPLKFYFSDCIAKRICLEKEEGFSTRELARKYGYSESRIRQILSRSKSYSVSKIENYFDNVMLVFNDKECV